MIKHLESEKVWPTILRATNALVDTIKPTFGPMANKVIIPNKFSPKQPSVLDDGVAIARVFELEDEFENQIINVIKQVAEKTNSRVGDGTTSSLIILQAILNEIAKIDKDKIDTHEIIDELQWGAKEAVEQLSKQAKQVTKVEDLAKVARISFDNEKISKAIADLVYKIGHDGVVTVQESNTMEVKTELVDGFEFNKGYLSPYMATNQERMEAVFDNLPYILITDFKFSLATDAIQLMEKLVKEGLRQVVMVAEGVDGDALATFIVNKIQGKFSTLIIEAPGYDDKPDFLADLAVITGGQVLKKDLMKLEDFKVSMLGQADRVVSKPDSTVIIGGKGKKSEIKKAIEQVKVLIGKATGYKLEQLQKRLGRLVNGIALIKVGAPTEHEMRALKYKVEDAVNAVKVAYKSGVVAGGGISLSNLKTSSSLLNNALLQPAIQLLDNSGMFNYPIMKDNEIVLNIMTGKVGNFMDIGVVDPVEVLQAGIESAVSIACLLVSTKGILAEFKEKDNGKT